jgi:hypothetical protein
METVFTVVFNTYNQNHFSHITGESFINPPIHAQVTRVPKREGMVIYKDLDDYNSQNKKAEKSF